MANFLNGMLLGASIALFVAALLLPAECLGAEVNRHTRWERVSSTQGRETHCHPWRLDCGIPCRNDGNDGGAA